MIERNDGTPFVTQPYRVRLDKSRLKRKLKQYCEEYGDKVCFIRYPDKSIEAVFSKYKGALIGENIANHFSQYTNLVYAEDLSDGRILLVVVVNKEIFIDDALSESNFQADVQSWLESDNSFNIFCYGAISEQLLSSLIQDSAQQTADLQVLTKAVLQNLSTKAAYATQELDEALKKAKLTSNTRSWLLLMTCIVVVLFAWMMWPQHKQKIVHVDFYSLYQQALTKPAPAMQLQKAADYLDSTQSLSGWGIKNIKLVSDGVDIQLSKSQFSSFQELKLWAAQHQAAVSTKNNVVTLKYSPNLMTRAKPYQIVMLQQSLFHLLDKIKQMMPTTSIKIESVSAHSHYSAQTLLIKLDNISTINLRELAQCLKGYPLVLQRYKFEVENGLLSGSINLQLLGKV